MSRNYGSLLRSAALVLATALASAAPSWAVVTFSNLGPGDAVTPGGVFILTNRSVAISFTATVSGPLDTLRLPIFTGGNPTQPLVISLRAGGPNPNGAVLESWTLNAADVPVGPLKVLTSVTHPVLTAGTQYWVRGDSAETGLLYLWSVNAIGALGFTESTDQGASWINITNVSALGLEVNVQGPPAPTFQVRYFSNLQVPGGDSVINLTNDGAMSTGSDMAAMGQAQTGNLCVHVYAYTPDEQLASCCSCLVTPNGLNSLSVKNDLASNPLTPVIPSSLVVKLIAAAPQAGACNPWKPIAGAATGQVGATAALAQLAPAGLQAWGTTLHQAPVAGTYDVTETPFSRGLLSPAEYDRMTQLCGFNKANGSGYGICKSCKLGGLGASAK